MVYLGCDHAGYALQQVIKQHLTAQKVAFVDCGNLVLDPEDNFTDYVLPVVNGVKSDPNNRGILVCGTGLGMSIAANHHVGIRAALVHDLNYATLARQHNDANVLCLGGRFIQDTTATALVDIFLQTPADPNPKYHARMQIADGSQH